MHKHSAFDAFLPNSSRARKVTKVREPDRGGAQEGGGGFPWQSEASWLVRRLVGCLGKARHSRGHGCAFHHRGGRWHGVARPGSDSGSGSLRQGDAPCYSGLLPPKRTKAPARQGPRRSSYGMARQYVQSMGKSLTPSLGIREPSDRPRVGLPLARALAALGPMRVGPVGTQEPADAGSQGVGGRGERGWCNATLHKVDACGRDIKGNRHASGMFRQSAAWPWTQACLHPGEGLGAPGSPRAA